MNNDFKSFGGALLSPGGQPQPNGGPLSANGSFRAAHSGLGRRIVSLSASIENYYHNSYDNHYQIGTQ